MVLAAQLNFESNEAKAYIAIAVGVMGLVYLYLRNSRKKRRGDPLERAPFASLSQQRSVEREFQNLLVEMSEMARQISAQLDTRAEKLNQLIIEADTKIAQLSQLQGQNPPAVSFQPTRESVAVPEAFTDDSPTDSRHTDVYTLAEQGLPATEIARQLDRPRGEVELILALKGSGGAKRAVG